MSKKEECSTRALAAYRRDIWWTRLNMRYSCLTSNVENGASGKLLDDEIESIGLAEMMCKFCITDIESEVR